MFYILAYICKVTVMFSVIIIDLIKVGCCIIKLILEEKVINTFTKRHIILFRNFSFYFVMFQENKLVSGPVSGYSNKGTSLGEGGELSQGVGARLCPSYLEKS